jgi:hypothetical protein
MPGDLGLIALTSALLAYPEVKRFLSDRLAARVDSGAVVEVSDERVLAEIRALRLTHPGIECCPQHARLIR